MCGGDKYLKLPVQAISPLLPAFARSKHFYDTAHRPSIMNPVTSLATCPIQSLAMGGAKPPHFPQTRARRLRPGYLVSNSRESRGLNAGEKGLTLKPLPHFYHSLISKKKS